MTGDLTLGAPAGILPTKRKDIPTMAAPIGAQISDRLKAVRDPVVDLLFIPIPGIWFGYAFGDNLLVAFLVTCVSTIFALIPQRIEQEIAAKSTEHDLIELTLNEFMAVHFVNFAFTLPDSALTSEPSGTIQRTFPHVLLDEVQV
jgi:hypothetical protein